MFSLFCARYASKICAFSNQMNIMKFLSSGLARQHRIARDDLSALLFYGFSNLRYYKETMPMFKYINDAFKFWTSIFPLYPEQK